MSLMMIPRVLYFYGDRCLGTSYTARKYDASPRRVVMELPSNNIDSLGPVNPKGYSEAEIRALARKYHSSHP